jgi:hypothetical protein
MCYPPNPANCDFAFCTNAWEYFIEGRTDRFKPLRLCAEHAKGYIALGRSPWYGARDQVSAKARYEKEKAKESV